MKILIAMHKQYAYPHESYYIPIQVGKQHSSIDLGIQGDNEGYHISEKNETFCELTALYWAWKNLDGYNYIGLVHYRRYFVGNGLKFKGKQIATDFEFLSDLKEYDIIVGKKRNYYIESVYNHYKNAHYIKDLDLARQIIEKDFPDYMIAFKTVMTGSKLHLFNMFVMSKPHFEQYCAWLFHILFKLEEKIDISNYDNYQKRVFGFLAERLFNVWIIKNNLRIKERRIVSLERENVLKKAMRLLKRKFL